MELKLPNYILSSMRQNKTSLGDNPAFPPEEEEKFVVGITESYFKEITERLSNMDGRIDTSSLQTTMNRLLTECQNIEKNNKGELEELCQNVVTKLFNIPEDTVNIKVSLSSDIDRSIERMLPEKMDDFSFDDINDMKILSDEIYKRRMLNSLITGAATYYAGNVNHYLKEAFEVHQYLPNLYSEIMLVNNILAYLTKDTLDNENDKSTDGGMVSVYVSSDTEKANIDAKGVIFPVLLEETIKGLLELSISHGLPMKKEKAQYVMMKSDFKLAEMWDLRLGIPLWKRIEDLIKECGADPIEVGLNFIFMEIAKLPSDKFNTFMQEVFMKTKAAKSSMVELLEYITEGKEQDEFDDYISQKTDGTVQLTDDDFYNPDELLVDCCEN